jgi:hypothetical protein
MSSEAWSDEENDLIVADYFAMLAKEIYQLPYKKSEHRRALRAKLNGRSDGSVEFKHQNISAALQGINEDWIRGYKPAFNFQLSLVEAVLRHLDRHQGWLEHQLQSQKKQILHEAGQLFVGPPPTLRNEPPPEGLDKMLEVTGRYDAASRDERNRILGKAGEELVFQHERAVLRALGEN